ncbi:MAG TPA: stress response translation initiation inhibitor YciH [Thermoanaerobaculia bacterium]|nr:stress response translation initiation inhibitor YciH [Thermoanaerobaculia bacterium]
MTRGGKRLVYSSDGGRICPTCGWSASDCHCSSNFPAAEAPIPPKISAKLSIEKRGSGSVVTVVGGLPANRGFLDALARELKKSCGAGGRAGETSVEIQGDHRERLRDLLARKGWTVKG